MNLADMLEDSFDNCFGSNPPLEELEDMFRMRYGFNLKKDKKMEDQDDSRCEDCGGEMLWCDCCNMWTKTCCIEYGTCMCS